jgi:hypothetical protein
VLGAQGVLNHYFHGDLAEIQIHASPLSDLERLGVERALKCKYGLPGGIAPLPPTGLSGVAGNPRVTLTWNLTPGATSYSLSRSTNNGSTYQIIASGLTTGSYVDTTAASGLRNAYRVAGVNYCGTGANSAAVIVNLPLPDLNLPLNTDGLRISWPGWAEDWELHATTHLTPPVVWVPVTNEVNTDNGRIGVSLPLDSEIRFFRLASP